MTFTQRELEDGGIELFAQAQRDLSFEEAASYLLTNTTGLNVDSDHGKDTPKRFVKMLKELTTPEPFDFTIFPKPHGLDEMIVEKGIEFTTLCNHHVVPFFGVAHVAYIPSGEGICGLSKLARTVEHFARRLNVQEQMTKDIADYIEDKLDPHGVAVVLEAEHMCMSIRGAKVRGAKSVTAVMRGVFADHSRTAKAEFYEHIRRS
jgi:GTP cyclohydrolase I